MSFVLSATQHPADKGAGGALLDAPPIAEEGARKKLRIAYAIQNVGIDFDQQTGDIVPVKYTLKGLQRAGHTVNCMKLKALAVEAFEDFSEAPVGRTQLPLTWTGLKNFQRIERGVRKLQGMVDLPYLAMFDSFRFFDACRQQLSSYDLCHEHNGLLSIGAALACRRKRVPYVLTFSADPIHESKIVGHPIRGLQLRAARWAAKANFRMADRIICVSEASRLHLIRKWGVDSGKIVVLPNGVDTSLFKPGVDCTEIRDALGLKGDLVVGFSGFFRRWHGLDSLLESFRRVTGLVPNCKLLLVGDGPERNLIEDKAESLGLSNSVVITGLVPHERVPAYLSAMDVAVLPYPRFEGELWFSPLKLYEYMASGRAIVASGSGQIGEVIQDDETGCLTEPGNVSELTSSIVRLLQNPSERSRLGDAARLQAVRRHSWESYVRRLENVYLEAVDVQVNRGSK